MYLRLIRCYETFLNGDFPQALLEINNLIQILKCTKMDTFFEPISDACFHIIYATKAYIMAFLNENTQQVIISISEDIIISIQRLSILTYQLSNNYMFPNRIIIFQILKDIKQYSSFNNVEKAAVYAIKSKVFLEYPHKGIKIALQLAEFARDFNNIEMRWISTWLKAKGRQRRFDRDQTLPFRDELEAAYKLCSCENDPEYLLCASNVFYEAGFILKLNGNKTYLNRLESRKYFKLSSNLIL